MHPDAWIEEFAPVARGGNPLPYTNELKSLLLFYNSLKNHEA